MSRYPALDIYSIYSIYSIYTIYTTRTMLPLLLLLVAGALAQDLTCPTGVTNPNTFYIIGASGGDSTVTYRVAMMMES